MKQIFPKEILENTKQVHQFKHSKKSTLIYTTFLSSLIAIFIVLPFIKVDIHTSAKGILKSEKEHVKLTTIYSGKVLKNNIQINKHVSKGDTLLILDDYDIKNKLDLLNIWNVNKTWVKLFSRLYYWYAFGLFFDKINSCILFVKF